MSWRREFRVLNKPPSYSSEHYAPRHAFEAREPSAMELSSWAALARLVSDAAAGRGNWREIKRRLCQVKGAGVFGHEHGGPVCAGLYEAAAQGVRMHDRARFVADHRDQLIWYADDVAARCAAALAVYGRGDNDNGRKGSP